MLRPITTLLAFITASVAFSMPKNLLDPSPLRYREEGSFGSAKQNEPAKPADTDVYQRRDVPPEDVPAAEASGADDSGSRDQGAKRPKYRDVYDEASKRQGSGGSSGGRSGGYHDDESIGVSIGVGFGFRYFSGSLGVTVPINKWVAWGISGNYLTKDDDKEAEVRSGGDLSLILRVPNPTPLTPFFSIGPGMESWKRSKDEGSGMAGFDESESPTGNWSVGATVRLARYVSLIGALKSTTYTDRPPRSFNGDHSTYELRTFERFEFGFAFIF